MDLSQAIRIRITNLITEKNINVSKLSTLAGIEYICEGLNITLKEFFDDKVFDNIEMKD